MHRVEDVEEVVSRRAFVFRVRVRKELLKLLVSSELGIQGLDADLIVLRNRDPVYLCLLEQVLLALQHVSEEILVDGRLLWQIELH